MIRGEYKERDGSNTPGIVHIGSVDDFPLVMDGGCSVIRLLYDADTGRVVGINCNGTA